MNEIEELKKEIELCADLIRSCGYEGAAGCILSSMMAKERKLEELIRIKRSKLGCFIRQKNRKMVIELHRVDEFGNHETLSERASFPVDAEGAWYGKCRRWAAENGVVIQNLDQFRPFSATPGPALL